MTGPRDIRRRVEDRPHTDYSKGRLRIAPVKATWFSANMIGTVIALLAFPSWQGAAVWLTLSILTLAGGHSLAMHRKLIHGSYDCPAWLEHFGIHLACLVGLGGPFTMMRAHDIRDWAQRQPDCHAFYSQHASIVRDTVNQLFMRFELETPPRFHFPDRLERDPWMVWLQRTSILQNALLALVLFAIGGWAWALWGVCVRVFTSMLGHSLVGWFAHNCGPQDWCKPEAGVQGYNVRGLSLFTFGEAYHNNHHAFPECANFGLMPGQWDAGYAVLRVLERFGLVWNLRHTPEVSPGDTATVRTAKV